MSIISEALKKAEKNRDKTLFSKEDMDRILGPERKLAYSRDKLSAKISQRHSGSDGSNDISTSSKRYINGKILIVSGILLLFTIIFLARLNIFITPSPNVKMAKYGGPSAFEDIPVEAETYTDMKSEAVSLGEKADFIDKMTRVFKNDSIRGEFVSNFTLNGIIYDRDGSWAIINNRVVRIGDTLDGAKVISIAPQKVELLFKNERFDLAVK